MNRPVKAPSSKRSSLQIHIDGAAQGNPGPAGIGVLLEDSEGRRLREIAAYLGEATNNVAETCALIVALQEALIRGCREAVVFTDSQLLARQVSGEYRIRHPELRRLHTLIGHLRGAFSSLEIRHLAREKNRAADRLAGRAVKEGLRREARPPKKRPSLPEPPPGQPTFW